MKDEMSPSSPVNGDHVPSSSSATYARIKHARPLSPGPSLTDQQSAETRPPPKRARKAINCEPCRNSKLKCDRYVFQPLRARQSPYPTTRMSQKPTVFVLCSKRSVTMLRTIYTTAEVAVVGTTASCYQNQDEAAGRDDQQ